MPWTREWTPDTLDPVADPLRISTGAGQGRSDDPWSAGQHTGKHPSSECPRRPEDEVEVGVEGVHRLLLVKVPAQDVQRQPLDQREQPGRHGDGVDGRGEHADVPLSATAKAVRICAVSVRSSSAISGRTAA